MPIYKSTRVLPYVYMCQEKNSPYFYIGYRYRNYVPSTEDLGTYYFTSNNYVKENFDNFEITIIAEFFTKKDAYKFETLLIKDTKSEYQINQQKNIKIKNKVANGNFDFSKYMPRSLTKESARYQWFKRNFIGPVLSRRQAKIIRENT